MNCQVTKKHGGNLILLSERHQCGKAAHSVVPILHRPRKDKVMETVERVEGVEGEGGMHGWSTEGF